MKKSVFAFCLFLTGYTFAQPAGNLDPAFGVGGKVVTSINTEDKAYGVALQTDEKILVAGFTLDGTTGKDFVCIRYNTDGSLDNTFGSGGIVTTDLQLGSDDIAYSIALQTDGKIILAGSSDDGSDRDAALVRYNTDGSLDLTFGVNGIVLTDFDSNQQDEIKTVKIHALTGNIIVGGSSVISSDVSKPVVARYLSDGSLDNTFNTTGIRLLWITPLDYQYLFSVEDLVVQSTGKISAVGWRDFPGLSWDSDYWAGRINSDGTMDVTFSTDGVNVYNGPFNGHDRAFSMLLNPDNSMVVSGGGYLTTLYYEATLFELSATGTASPWSGYTDFGGTFNDISYAVKEDSNGKFVLAGSSGTLTNKTFAISRKNADASVDNTFGSGGQVTTTFGANSLNECFDMVIQSDNKIVAVGYAGNDFAIARYLGEAQPNLDDFFLISPADLAVNQNYSSLILDWSDAFGATSYEVDVALDVAFTSSPQTYTVSSSTKTLTGLDPSTQYFWRVRASDGSVFGIDSEIRSFTTNSLENFNLISPVNNAVNQQYVSLPFDWSTALGAVEYELEIDSIVTFTDNPETFTIISSGTTLSNLEPSTDYFWHVRASNDGTNFGAWSTTYKFTTKADWVASFDEQASTHFNVYPSPATDLIYLISEAENTGKPFSIIDENGRVVLTGTVSGEQTVISINTLSSGIYYIRIENETGEVMKIVKA